MSLLHVFYPFLTFIFFLLSLVVLSHLFEIFLPLSFLFQPLHIFADVLVDFTQHSSTYRALTFVFA